MAVLSEMPNMDGQVQGVRAAGEGFLELAVEARRRAKVSGQVPGRCGDPVLAGRVQVGPGLGGDEQVGVGGVGPALAPVVQPSGRRRQVVRGPDVVGDGDPPVGQVDVGELESPLWRGGGRGLRPGR